TQIRTLRDGALTVTAVLHDRAGNASAARTATAVKDTTLLALVATAPDTAPSGAGGTVEGLTNNASRTSATFNEAITPTTHPAETRSTITVKNRNNVTVAGVGSVSGETITFTPSSPLSDAGSPYSVTVHAVDAALTTESIDIAYTFRVDTVAPAAPVITSVTNPVNASNQSAVQVRGTAAEVGRSVRVTIGSLVATPTVAGDGTWSTSLDLTDLPDGTTSVSASQADAAGNASSAGTAELVKDTVAPVFVAASPRDGSVVQPPSSIEVTFSERLGSGSVTVAGVPGTSARSGDAIVFTPTGPIPDGTYTVQTSVTDVAGNSGGHDTTFTVDGTGPAIADLAATATTAAQQSSTVSGSTEAGASVAITATDGTDEVTTSVTAGDDGEFSKALDLTGLADGTVTVTARATDTVGNPGPQASTTAPRDATAPTVGELTATDSTLAAPTSTVTGVRSESSSVAVSATDGEATVRAAVPAGTGEFSVDLDLSSLETGTITVEAVATDGSGNTGPAATTTTTRDATVPGSTTTLDPTPRRILHGESLVLSGTVTRVEDSEPYGDVHLTAYDERGRVIDLGDVQPDDSGAFSLRITPDHNATYAASYAGDALAAESTSRPQATKVSVRITAKSVQKKRKVRVKGSVSPDKAGEKVRLHLKRGRYRTIATTKVRANGSYAFRVELPRVKSRLRVVMAATDGNAGGATRLVVRRR
uniref:Ig-like domain-containing protein n=1 Tax=Nocardioides sp. TaxID=35761 RepID=UPI00356A6378